MANISNWRCVKEECNAVLGRVIGGTLDFDESLSIKNVRIKGPNLAIDCPECGTTKTWYTSDPIARAAHQLVEAMVNLFAFRLTQKLNEPKR
jgi:hypothetical protein